MQDILNNLEPADLEDDDLMLDVDLPEDGSLRTQTTVAPGSVSQAGRREREALLFSPAGSSSGDSQPGHRHSHPSLSLPLWPRLLGSFSENRQQDADGMAHFDRSERGGRKGHWRRRQPHWNGLDHFHNDNRGPVFQQYDGYTCHGGFMVGPRPLPPVGRHDGYSGALDEITLKHMAQDCSSVKNKLLKLKSLLQMEDGGPEVVEEGEEDNSTTLQLEELMKEVRELKEELRNKERTITQLTLQQQARAPSLGGDRQTHHDKATQTPWRGQGNSHAQEGERERGREVERERYPRDSILTTLPPATTRTLL
ncbi:unnamed protein product [Coregonus sp. 'balchen']|nr:unnamed protein product [Coregonus sp. 'balchen']